MDSFIEIVKNKTNEELLKMVYEFAEWSPEMLTTVETELAIRNILPGDIKARKQQLTEMEDEKLLMGKKASIIGQVVGWICVSGLLGIFIGYHYSFSKVRNQYSGQQYFKYDENSRNNGSLLFYTSIVLTTLILLYGLLKKYPI